jgi:hypothetical protein
MLPEILQARENGYTCDQIAEALGKKGIIVNGNKLRTYLARIKSATTHKSTAPTRAAPAPAPAQPRFTMKTGKAE